MTVRVAIAGLGNCANSLIQGVHYYRGADATEEVPGLMHVELGGYHISDIEFVAAFDVDSTKVGKDLTKAMWSGENNTIEFTEVPDIAVPVLRGPTLDGLGIYYREAIEESAEEAVDVAAALKASGADVLAPGPVSTIRRPRRESGAHQPVKRRRKHGLQEYAGEGPIGVQEDLQDPSRNLADRPRFTRR
jgi:myo-inositol-1-phosphate synthase